MAKALPFGETSKVARAGATKEVVTTMIDKPYRSMIKAFSWRVTGTIDTIVISYLISGKMKVAFTIGFIELFTKISLYYIHERVWNKLKFGRVSAKEDYQI